MLFSMVGFRLLFGVACTSISFKSTGIDWHSLHQQTPPKLEAFLPALNPGDKPLHEHDVSQLVSFIAVGLLLCRQRTMS
jgi:hypothetical protein